MNTKDERLVCPFCNTGISKYDGYTSIDCFFYKELVEEQKRLSGYADYGTGKDYNNIFEIQMLKCSYCGEVSFVAQGKKNLQNIRITLYPKASAKKLPDYIPLAIREDYEEAYSIIDLSPKASAILCRRCLQTMIRDCWNVKKGRLELEIKQLEKQITNEQWKAIDSIRSIGNIGAHLKNINNIVSINSQEVMLLIQLIEILIDEWYIVKHNRNILYDNIVALANEKDKLEKQNKNQNESAND